ARYPATGYNYISTIRDIYPLQYGFDLPNTQGWSVEQVSGSTGWDINSYGSGLNPSLSPATGVKAALFPSPVGSSGTISRLVSPCLDFTNMTVPTLRFWMSQNPEGTSDTVRVRVSPSPGVWTTNPLKTVR